MFLNRKEKEHWTLCVRASERASECGLHVRGNHACHAAFLWWHRKWWCNSIQSPLFPFFYTVPPSICLTVSHTGVFAAGDWIMWAWWLWSRSLSFLVADTQNPGSLFQCSSVLLPTVACWPLAEAVFLLEIPSLLIIFPTFWVVVYAVESHGEQWSPTSGPGSGTRPWVMVWYRAKKKNE